MATNDKHSTKHRTEPEKPKRGKPKYVIPERHLPKVLEAIRNNNTQASIAKALGISFHTWQRVRDEDKRIRSAIDETLDFEEKELVNLLMEKARNGETTAVLFALKSRHGYRDHGPVTGGGDEQKVNVTINLPGAQGSVEDYLKTVKGRTVEGQ